MYDLSYGPSSLIPITMAILTMLLFLWVWFLVNRASVRANEQIRLLKEIAEQQRQQTALLKTLVQNARGEQDPSDNDELSPTLGFKGFIPER